MHPGDTVRIARPWRALTVGASALLALVLALASTVPRGVSPAHAGTDPTAGTQTTARALPD